MSEYVVHKPRTFRFPRHFPSEWIGYIEAERILKSPLPAIVDAIVEAWPLPGAPEVRLKGHKEAVLYMRDGGAGMGGPDDRQPVLDVSIQEEGDLDEDMPLPCSGYGERRVWFSLRFTGRIHDPPRPEPPDCQAFMIDAMQAAFELLEGSTGALGSYAQMTIAGPGACPVQFTRYPDQGEPAVRWGGAIRVGRGDPPLPCMAAHVPRKTPSSGYKSAGVGFLMAGIDVDVPSGDDGGSILSRFLDGEWGAIPAIHAKEMRSALLHRFTGSGIHDEFRDWDVDPILEAPLNMVATRAGAGAVLGLVVACPKEGPPATSIDPDELDEAVADARRALEPLGVTRGIGIHAIVGPWEN